MTDMQTVLLVEDEETDVLLMQRAFRSAEMANPLEVVRDGAEAVEFLGRERPETNDRLPSLVLLDIKIPRRTGFEVLGWIRRDALLRSLPVAILTSTSRPEDIERAYLLGANAFWVKPTSLEKRKDLATFIKRWLVFNQPPLVSTEGVRAARLRAQ